MHDRLFCSVVVRGDWYFSFGKESGSADSSLPGVSGHGHRFISRSDFVASLTFHVPRHKPVPISIGVVFWHSSVQSK